MKKRIIIKTLYRNPKQIEYLRKLAALKVKYKLEDISVGQLFWLITKEEYKEFEKMIKPL